MSINNQQSAIRNQQFDELKRVTPMSSPRIGRRRFMQGIATSAAAVSALPKDVFGMTGTPESPARGVAVMQNARPKIRFSVTGINHNHINSQVNSVLRGGGELVALYAQEDDLAASFMKTFPQVKRVQ